MDKRVLIISVFILCQFQTGLGQFIDHFDSQESPSNRGWATVTGDGKAQMKFEQMDGYASIMIDATQDRRNIWWAVLRREITEIDTELLAQPGYELRSEVKIRVSHAPRRVNLHFNHQRTTDFHSHLMEYDIPDTTNWHVISLTTRNFDALPGDRVNAQMALIDWGLHKYRLDIDYFKVDVVEAAEAGPDLGNPLPYRPPMPNFSTFHYHVTVLADATIDRQYPDMNFKNWVADDAGGPKLLAVSGTQVVILRWDIEEFKDRKISGPGLLELTVHSLQRSPDYEKDFGMVRITEIIGGDPSWDAQTVTAASLHQGKVPELVINEQLIIDAPLPHERDSKVFFTISQPVLQRLITGKTLGLAINPLGAVNAVFYSSDDSSQAPRIHFDLE